jgi:hypothetical protein
MSRFFDLYGAVQSNPKFVADISRHFANIDKIEKKVGAAIASNSEDAAAELGAVYRKCAFNPGLLFPWFFPTAFNGQPLSLRTRPFAMALTSMNVGGSTTIRGSRQISKSSTLAARALVNAWLLKDWSAIYIAPHAEHQRTFNRKLAEMERMCRYHVKDPVLKQNLSYREFPTGSKIETAYVTSSASGIRGKTANEIDFDEFQQFDVNFLPEVEQVQKVPKLKATTYSGTSLTIETALEAKYQAGSCGRWMIKLGNGTYCDCTDPEQILQLFRPQGLTCPITSRPIDPTAGRFEHKYPERIEDGHVSLHIPQIIIPELATEPEQWRTLYQSFFDYKASGQLKKFLQEVLGIPTEEGAKELTEADVKRICVDSWTPDGMLKRVQQGYYKIIVAGVDWGGSDHNLADKTKLSFTFHMVLGVTQDNQLDILFMRKYAGCNYAQVINGIVNTNKLFHVRYIASDFSAGSHYNLNLRSQGGVAWNSHLVMQYGGNSNRFFVRANSELLNHYWLHKTDAISTVIEAIKQERPRIRCYNWELAKNDLFDLTHLYRSITTNATGRESFHYRRHSTKPDDGLHALTFAYTMARIVLGESLLEDKAAAQELYRTLGVVSPRPGVSYFPDAHSPNGLGGKLFTSG